MPDPFHGSRKFEEAVQEWRKAAGAPDNFYGVESWIEWSRNFQLYGLDTVEYFQKEMSLS
jgi:hypothetical protein